MMPVRNESCRYLRDALAQLSRWVDAIVILDDASDDNTFEVATTFSKVICCQNEAQEYPINKSGLRAKLWQLASRENPDWILSIDADEIIEDRIINEIGLLLSQNDYDIICFRLFNFWKSYTHYRVDGDWNPWKHFMPFIARYKPGLENTALKHDGRFPGYFNNVYSFFSDIRVKHLGWAREEEHHLRYLRCQEADLQTSEEESPHTRSIVAPDSKISLEQWMASKELYFLER